jgi:(p)ppGpp synthase/HD superfamily hydrolase
MISPTLKGYIPDYELAIMFATEAHAGQFDKNGQPYILHPLRVMSMAQALGLDVTSQKAGVLHDTDEDTELMIKQLEFYFGIEVATTVDALSRRWLSPTEKEPYETVFIPRLLEDERAVKLKMIDVGDNMRPERRIEGSSGLNGRYVRTIKVLRSALWRSGVESADRFLTAYRKHHPWMTNLV